MVQLQYRNDNVVVGTTAQTVLALVNPAEREIVVIKNVPTGGEVISIAIGLGQTAELNAGITLNAGETYIESIDSALIPSYEPFSIIGSGANATISLFERQNKK